MKKILSFILAAAVAVLTACASSDSLSDTGSEIQEPSSAEQTETAAVSEKPVKPQSEPEPISEPDKPQIKETPSEFAEKCCSRINYEYLGTLENGEKMQQL